MGNEYSISDSEWRILKVLWNRSPLTLPEILEKVKDAGWSTTTVQTFLARLVKKGAVGTRRQGKGYLYSPLVSEAECQRAEARDLLNRVFDGSVHKLIASFADSEGLTEKDLEALEKLLEGKK